MCASLFELFNRQVTWEGTVFSLLVPGVGPLGRTERLEGLEENLAWGEFLTLDGNTLVVVDVGLETVLGLVLLWESGVETWGLQGVFRHVA